MLTDADYQKAADSLGLTLPHVKAFAEVESSGNGFLPSGEVKILFERHVFYQRLLKNCGKAEADSIANAFPSLCNKTPGGYGKNSEQHQKLQQAVKIHRVSALESCSWGAFQIMGYHWQTVGMTGVQDFVNAMYTDAGQLDILVKFLLANPAIVAALKAKDWTKAAKLYNGPKQSGYDTKLKAAYAKAGGK